jgi:hypothetical protein
MCDAASAFALRSKDGFDTVVAHRAEHVIVVDASCVKHASDQATGRHESNSLATICTVARRERITHAHRLQTRLEALLTTLQGRCALSEAHDTLISTNSAAARRSSPPVSAYRPHASAASNADNAARARSLKHVRTRK